MSGISKPLFNIRNRRFWKVKVLKYIGIAPNGRVACWKCKCDCGRIFYAQGSLLRGGYYKSCGCGQAANVTHGHTRNNKTTKTYNSWCGMRARCFNSKAINFDCYGGRGITVCARWSPRKTGFLNFLSDMGLRPIGKTLDRRNVNGNYTLSNCRWAKYKDQSKNRRKHEKSR